MYRHSRRSFLKCPSKSTVSLTKHFSGKKQNFQSWDYFPQVPDYQDFRIIGRRLKWILLYYVLKSMFSKVHFSPLILHFKFTSYCQDETNQSYKNSVLLMGSEQVTWSKTLQARWWWWWWWWWWFVSNHDGSTEAKRSCGSVALLLDSWPSCLCWIFCIFLTRAVHVLAPHWLGARWNVGLRTPDCTLPSTAPILNAIIAAIWWQWRDWMNRSPVQCAALCHLATEFALRNHRFCLGAAVDRRACMPVVWVATKHTDEQVTVVL